MFFLVSLFWLACFVLLVYIILQTYQGKTIVLPVVDRSRSNGPATEPASRICIL
jgi:hypothetical protein